MKKRKNKSETIAMFGILLALAMLMSYLETLIPISIGIPGVKPGFANLVTVVCLYHMGVKKTVLLSLMRVILVGFTFGNMAALLYSFAGAMSSLICMIAAKRSKCFGAIGVSILGGVFHNLGQLFIAAFVVENAAVFWYFPLLIISGTTTGALVGMLSGEMMKRLPEILNMRYY